MDLKNVVIGLLIGLIITTLGLGAFVVLYPRYIAHNNVETVGNTATSKNDDKKVDTTKKESKEKDTKESTRDKSINNTAKKGGMSEKDRKERIAVLTSGMEIKKDDMENVTRYSYHENYDTKGIKLMMIIVDNHENHESRLTLGALYKGDDWIFFDKIIFKADNERFTINTSHLNAVTDVIMGEGVFELHEIPINEKNKEYVQKIANAKNVRMRFDGKYSEERDMTPTEIERIRNMVELYDLMDN